MKKLRLVAVALGALLVVSGANAITYGRPDGNGHPNVGAMILKRPSDGALRIVCTGSLASPRVFITASHCTAFAQSQGLRDVWVTFDPKFDPATSTLHHGTMHTNPLFNQRQSDPGDLAVITLDEPVTGITPVQLPTLGLLDRMKDEKTLNGTYFTSVGYGIQEPQTAPGGIVHAFPAERWVASGEINALNPSWLRISQNAATGDGGTCNGDSGGPQFLGDTNLQVSVTITGDIQCYATNVDYRLDTPQARAFLSRFLTLP